MMPNQFSANLLMNPATIDSKLTYQQCLDHFTQYLQQYPCFSPSDLMNLNRYWDYSITRKNKKMMASKQVCYEMKFICSGHAKYYTEDENGKYLLAFLSGFSFCAHIESFYYQTESSNAAI